MRMPRSRSSSRKERARAAARPDDGEHDEADLREEPEDGRAAEVREELVLGRAVALVELVEGDAARAPAGDDVYGEEQVVRAVDAAVRDDVRVAEDHHPP